MPRVELLLGGVSFFGRDVPVLRPTLTDLVRDCRRGAIIQRVARCGEESSRATRVPELPSGAIGIPPGSHFTQPGNVVSLRLAEEAEHVRCGTPSQLTLLSPDGEERRRHDG